MRAVLVVACSKIRGLKGATYVSLVTHVSGSDRSKLAEEEGFEPPRPFRV
jgi:hypothetical protein